MVITKHLKIKIYYGTFQSSVSDYPEPEEYKTAKDHLSNAAQCGQKSG